MIFGMSWYCCPSLLRHVGISRGQMKQNHVFMGIFIYIAGLSTCLSGAQQWIGNNPNSPNSSNSPNNPVFNNITLNFNSVKLQPQGVYDLSNNEVMINLYGCSVYMCMFCTLYVIMPRVSGHVSSISSGDRTRDYTYDLKDSTRVSNNESDEHVNSMRLNLNHDTSDTNSSAYDYTSVST